MDQVRWLLIDSCGVAATMAVGRGSQVLATAEVVGREFSARWPASLREMLRMADLFPQDVQVIGVVSGPGSFTGVRVGLALAKGLCEATGARMINLSRLQIMQEFADNALELAALIDAGRGDWFTREGALESTVAVDDLRRALAGRRVVAFGESIEALATAGIAAQAVRFTAEQGLRILLERWRGGQFADIATAEPNYVRGGHEMYAQRAAGV